MVHHPHRTKEIKCHHSPLHNAPAYEGHRCKAYNYLVYKKCQDLGTELQVRVNNNFL